MTNNEIITITNVSFSYPDKHDVLCDISLRVNKGERVAVIGPNGGGKTTLFLLLCGILAHNSGSIIVNGKKVKYNQFNTDISYLFQSPDDQLFTSTVFDDVAFGPQNMGLTNEEVKKRVISALDSVNCRAFIDKPPHHLSGGQKRLVALATLLSMQPEIMLLDEPTSNLDLKNRRNIINILSSLQKTLVIASHDLEFLLEICSRLIIINNGKIIVDGPIVDVLSNEELMKAHNMEKPHSLYPHSHKRVIADTPKEH